MNLNYYAWLHRDFKILDLNVWNKLSCSQIQQRMQQQIHRGSRVDWVHIIGPTPSGSPCHSIIQFLKFMLRGAQFSVTETQYVQLKRAPILYWKGSINVQLKSAPNMFNWWGILIFKWIGPLFNWRGIPICSIVEGSQHWKEEVSTVQLKRASLFNWRGPHCSIERTPLFNWRGPNSVLKRS